MVQDSDMRRASDAKFTLGAWRSISLGARDVLARLRTIGCDECSQPIRCWNRRVWLSEERRVHSQRWHRHLFSERYIRFMANEIQQHQIKAEEFPSSPGRRRPSDDHERPSSCIGRGDRIFGKFEVRVAKIEGEAEGEISGDDIEIAASAVVVARIEAKRLKVSGQVDGEIIAHERVELLPTARLRCTITTPTLVITEGAQFDGYCKMPRG